MKKYILAFTVLALLKIDALGQEIYTITLESRNNVIDMTNGARALIKEKKADEAVNQLLEAIGIDSVYREAYLLLYQAGALNTVNTARVLNGLEKGKRVFEEDDELYFYCGEIYRLNSEPEKALAEYNKAIAYSKVNGEDFYLVCYYYFNRGNYYLKAGNPELALEDYSYSIKLKPDFSAALLNRGVCLFRLGRKTEACQDWEKARDLGYEPAIAYCEKHCKQQPR